MGYADTLWLGCWCEGIGLECDGNHLRVIDGVVERGGGGERHREWTRAVFEDLAGL